MDDEEQGGSLIPILALAHEHHPDPEMRPYKEPISAEMRERLIVGAAAGVMAIYDYFEAERVVERDGTVQPPPSDAKRLRSGETSRAHAGQARSLSTAVPRRRCIEGERLAPAPAPLESVLILMLIVRCDARAA